MALFTECALALRRHELPFSGGARSSGIAAQHLTIGIISGTTTAQTSLLSSRAYPAAATAR